ncbi:CTTNBP2 N-terminal-like protein [Pygocentrus nattereri]|uniref:Cortactin-binding protein-2 N-terminal domain-containing protein n=1 Tax=Pygocentrus nattereri TaxID=42514 RepID=A0AAR2J018_PYGNA|nr:CTTNBP2 N-terminal-like protein [Pygocentrus nattereri]
MAPTTESRLNVDALSKRDVLLLFSVLEGELEARDLVIQALRAQRRDAYVRERYGRYDLSDPFLALQRDSEVLQGSAQAKGDGANSSQTKKEDKECYDPVSILNGVVEHCRKMQEQMLKQLAAAESRHRRVIADLEEEKRRHAEDTAEGDDVTCILEKERERLLQQLEFEKLKVSRIEKENKRLHDQLEDERVQHKQLMAALGRECKRSGSRAHEEAQRAGDLSHRLERERTANQTMRVELEEEKRRAMQIEARREELLAEFDTEREQLGLRLRKEEARCRQLQDEVERLRREAGELRGEEEKIEMQMSNGASEGSVEKTSKSQTKMNGHHTSVKQEDSSERQKKENEENGGFHPSISPSQSELINGSSLSNVNTDSLSSYSTGSTPQTNSSPGVQAAYQAGIHQRFHAARHKFQSTAEQDSQPTSPFPSLSPCASPVPPLEGNASKQAARSTLTQALSRFSSQQSLSKAVAPNSSPFGTDYRALSPGVRSPTIPRADRGIPPPIPPKKPGLAETPPSPATLRATHLAQMSAGCGHKSTPENSKEPDLLLSSSG